MHLDNFEIGIPKEFLLDQDPTLDFILKAQIFYKAESDAVYITDIQCPWQAIQLIDWTDPALEEYFVTAATHFHSTLKNKTS